MRWCKGDASQADEKLLPSIDVLVCLVGSPPVPTFSKRRYEEQLFMNGTSCVNAIESAARAGIKRVVLMGAQLPLGFNSDRFAYAKGKRLAFEAAEKFSNISSEHSAIVLQPGAIYGKRYLDNGKVISLDWFLKPLAMVTPWRFVSVDLVAKKVAEAVIESEPYSGKFTVISNKEISKG